MHIRGEAMDLLDTFRDIIFLTFLTTQFFHLGIGQDEFSIMREPRYLTAWVTHLDYFKPSWLECSGSRPRPNCAAYKGVYDVFGKCQCKCTYYNATFGFYSRMWTCLDNIEVRNQSGLYKSDKLGVIYKYIDIYFRLPITSLSLV